MYSRMSIVSLSLTNLYFTRRTRIGGGGKFNPRRYFFYMGGARICDSYAPQFYHIAY